MKIKVLVVEDNPITLEDIRQILESIGMEVSVASNGEDALLLVHKNTPDVLLIDIKLSGKIDGIETVELINKVNRFPVVYLTANTNSSFKSRAFKTNPDSFLSKPFDEKDLINSIELAFNNQFKINSDASLRPADTIFLHDGKKFTRVDLKDILYIEADGSYSRVITRKKEFSLSHNLNAIGNKIENQGFIRVHRSFIANIRNLDGMDSNYLFFEEKTIPYSKTYRYDLMKLINRVS